MASFIGLVVEAFGGFCELILRVGPRMKCSKSNLCVSTACEAEIVLRQFNILLQLFSVLVIFTTITARKGIRL